MTAPLFLLLLHATDFDLWACGSITVGWKPGINQGASGLHRLTSKGDWAHPGYDHPYINGIAADPREPGTFYLASGNGLIRARSHGDDWRIMTGWDMTEANGVAVDAAGQIFLALPDGIGYSPDGGLTWTRRDNGLRRKYTQAIRADRAQRGHFVAATELGIFRTTDSGENWTQVGAPRLMTFDVAQSPHNAIRWLAVTQTGEAFESLDGAATWKKIATVPKVHTLYNAAFDASNHNRIALGGWSTGVLLTEDNGKSWKSVMPGKQVWRVAVHPTNGTLYAYVHEKELFKSTDSGKTWQPAGLPGGVIRDLTFLPAAQERRK